MFDPTEVFVHAQTNAQFISAQIDAQNVTASGTQSGLASPPMVVPRNVVAIRPEIAIVAAGAQGPASGVGDLHFTFAQTTPASTWVVVHNLGKYPAVMVADSAGTWVIGDIHYDSINQCTLTFVGGFSGSAYLN